MVGHLTVNQWSASSVGVRIPPSPPLGSDVEFVGCRVRRAKLARQRSESGRECGGLF